MWLSTPICVNWLKESWHKNWFWRSSHPWKAPHLAFSNSLFAAQLNCKYCWWTKSCTTWDVWNPINNGRIIILGGAGFCPSTVWWLNTSGAFSHWECLILEPCAVFDLQVVGRAKWWHGALDGGFELPVSHTEIHENLIDLMDSALRETEHPDQERHQNLLPAGEKPFFHILSVYFIHLRSLLA